MCRGTAEQVSGSQPGRFRCCAMIFSLLIQASPVGRQSSYSAYRFACAVLESGHVLHRVFFFGDGAAHATRLELMPAGEPDLPQLWQRLARERGFELLSCIGSALRRGIVDSNEARRHGIDGASLRDGFELAGLGQLIDAALYSDRLVSFGG